MGLIAALLLIGGQGRAEEKEPSALIELGGATEWGLRDGGQSFGPAVSIDVTPLKDLLEIEAGVTSLFGGGHTEWSTDLVFKKPFTLSKTVEVEFGVGPEWIHTTGGGKTADSLGGEAVVEFQFWPWPKSKLRLVSGAELRIRFRQRAWTIDWGNRRPAYRNSITRCARRSGRDRSATKPRSLLQNTLGAEKFLSVLDHETL